MSNIGESFDGQDKNHFNFKTELNSQILNISSENGSVVEII